MARVLLVVALVLTGGKLVQVQGFEARALSEQSSRQRSTNDAVPAERGSIMDRNGHMLAFSSESRKLYANPRDLAAKQDRAHADDPSEPTGAQYKAEIARFIAQTLGPPANEAQLLAELNKDARFTYFGPDNVEPAKARKITEKYPQLGAEYRATREYPAGRVGSTIVGAANWRMDEQKIRGVIGLENALDPMLAGTDGETVSDTAKGSSDLVIPGTQRELRPAVPGSDVELSIDSDLQFTLQEQVAAYAQRAGAKNASAVVLDAHTGEVYGLANDRSFDPSAPQWNPQELGNPVVTSPYEPGSVNKVITAAGAIEYRLAAPDTVMTVPGSIRIADSVVGDAWQHKPVPMTFTGVMAKSSNVGTLMTAQQLGEERFNDLVRKFGLGQRTGIELPGESAGSVPPQSQWSGTTFANLPIGQGLSMTTLQMAGMYQAIANDGVRVPPRVIRAEILPDGTRVERARPKPVQVVRPETARTVRDMLKAVVQQDPRQQGTGPQAHLEGYQISGKTGTAQQIDPACGCYSQSTYWLTFAGIVPADNPRFVVGVMLDAPRAGTPESKSAAPLFAEVARYLTQRYELPVSPHPAPTQVLQLR